uniref:Uncharacterized protein n=1 Tax=Chrysotila carterae TaxID=13221 RepID=A0A7S4C6W0_CHRCT|eukprot:2182264-Pleurochrysis_carterae.AAC.4
METTDELEEPDWQSTSEAVRDAHRSVSVPPQHRCIPSSVSVDGMSLHSNFRLAPEVGTASDLAQPGGFRRAHVLADETASEKQITYAQVVRHDRTHHECMNAQAHACVGDSLCASMQLLSD